MATTIRVVDMPGWDAGARSIDSFVFDGDVEFSFGQNVGIVCGLNTEDNSPSYQEIQHGVFCEDGWARVIEKGLLVTDRCPIYATTAVRISRRAGVVRIYLYDEAHTPFGYGPASDPRLWYTSPTLSEGEVFADCSLYIYGDEIRNLNVTDRGGGRLEGELPALAVSASETDNDYLLGSFPPLTAEAKDEAGERLFATFPELVAQITEYPDDWLLAKLPALTGFLVDQNSGIGKLPALIGYANEHWLVPNYNRVQANFPSLYGYASEYALSSSTLSAEFPPFMARLAEIDEDYVGGQLPAYRISETGIQLRGVFIMFTPPWHLELGQWSQTSQRLAAHITLPAPRSWGLINREAAFAARHTLPVPQIAATLGSQATFALPAPQINGAITQQALLTATVTLPEPQLRGWITQGSSAAARLRLPLPRLAATLGSDASLHFPALRLKGKVTVGRLLRGQFRLPAPRLTATLTGTKVLRGHLTLPAPQWNAWAGLIAHFTLPAPRLIAEVWAEADLAAEQTYVINMNTGAVTTARWGMFDQMAAAHGALYALRAGALYTIDAKTPLTMTLRFASQTFGSGLLKRCEAVYVQGHESQGLTLDAVIDETQAWPYQVTPDAARSYFGTHKVRVGRGLVFHTLGLVIKNRDGDLLDLGGLELRVTPLSRRPR